MDKIFFATTNKGKLAEAQAILKVEVQGTPLDIPEIQSLDPLAVAVQKAKDYFNQLKMPIFVEDLGLAFTALNGMPGAYIDAFMKTIGNEGLVKLLKNEENRGAVAKTVIVYSDNSNNLAVFEGEVRGRIAEYPKGDKGFGWDPIFIPDGENKTFGEMDPEEKNRYSMRRIALEKFEVWLNNFLTRKTV